MLTPMTTFEPNACRGVMFDLDGTLADTLEDLTTAGNAMRRAFGLEPLASEAYRFLVGYGAPFLAQRALALAEDDPRLPQAIEHFRNHLREQGHAHSTPYPDIPALLDALVERDVKLAVLSNKPDDSTVHLVQRVFGDWPFVDVRGHRPDAPPKPDPTAALEIAELAGIAPGQWCFVGDSGVDMCTAVNAGMRAVGVTWGFREVSELHEGGAQHVIDEPNELLALLGAVGQRETR